MDNLKTNSELKAFAREQLRSNWGKAVIVCLLAGVINGLCGSIPRVGMLISLVVAGPITLGVRAFFIKIKRGEHPLIESIFEGFNYLIPTIVLNFLILLFTFLWSLLLIVPGIIAGLSYSQAFYIINDNHGIDAMQAINMSKQMMQGKKGKLFMLYLSFLGWAILCVLSLGIGFLWLAPYMELTSANFYEDIKEASNPPKDLTDVIV